MTKPFLPRRSRSSRASARQSVARAALAAGSVTRAPAGVALDRALSKLGILSRSAARVAIEEGRVTVNGRVVMAPAHRVVPERVRITLDGVAPERRTWRTIVFYKPRGVVTTSRDPGGRRTIYDVLEEQGEDVRRLVTVGRLDLATSGLLILTTDTQLANRLTDPQNGVPRVYVVTVRGDVSVEKLDRLRAGTRHGGEMLRAASVDIRKSSVRETHLIVELREGRNREVRRLFESIGHEVTHLKRVRFGSLELGELRPGEWRELSRDEVARAFGG